MMHYSLGLDFLLALPFRNGPHHHRQIIFSLLHFLLITIVVSVFIYFVVSVNVYDEINTHTHIHIHTYTHTHTHTHTQIIIEHLYIIVNYTYLCYCISLYCSLSQLTQLEILDVGSNPLNRVPDVVSSLTSLKQLDMNSCDISSLPERFVCHMFITTSKHHYYLSLYYIYIQHCIIFKHNIIPGTEFS